MHRPIGRCRPHPIVTGEKGKVLPYSLPSVGPGADPCVQAVSLQATLSHPPSDRQAAITFRQVCSYLCSFHQMAPTIYMIAHIRFQLTYSFFDPKRMKGWVGLRGWLTCSGWFTHSGGHPSAAGRALDRESSPARGCRACWACPRGWWCYEETAPVEFMLN